MAGRRRAAAPHDPLERGHGARARRREPRAGHGGQRHEALDLSVNRLGQGKRIELISERPPPRDYGGIGRGAGLQALEGRAGRVVAAPEPSPDALLAD
jgi:hypothetical protein